MFTLRKCIILRKKNARFEFMGAINLKNKSGRGHVYHRVPSPLLLKTVHKHLGTEETSCWTFEGGMLFQASLVFVQLISPGSSCIIFHFMKC